MRNAARLRCNSCRSPSNDDPQQRSPGWLRGRAARFLSAYSHRSGRTPGHWQRDWRLPSVVRLAPRAGTAWPTTKTSQSSSNVRLAGRYTFGARTCHAIGTRLETGRCRLLTPMTWPVFHKPWKFLSLAHGKNSGQSDAGQVCQGRKAGVDDGAH